MGRAVVTSERLAKLNAILDGASSMLIVVQNNPDPDAIAAAAGLREIANELHGIACSVAHGGTIGRAENQALVRYLGLNPRQVEPIEIERFDRLAMVDAQPGAGNVNFDPAIRLDVVIDHHPIRRETRSARFTDVRSRYGATSTILQQYLAAANLEIPTPVATALLYGIRSDTQDLGREATRADIEAILDLYPRANVRVLGRIVSAPLPRSYFAHLRTALDNATLYADRVISYLDHLDSQEMIAETADLLLRVEGMSWSFCLGVVDGCLHGSLRGVGNHVAAGAVARKLGARRGFGGGHSTLAAIQIPLKPAEVEDPGRLRQLVRRISDRFLRLTGEPRNGSEALCDPASIPEPSGKPGDGS